MINSGGAVGAADLLQAPHEIIELDLAMPMSQLAQQVHRYHCCSCSDCDIFRAVTSLCTFAASMPTTHPGQSLNFSAIKACTTTGEEFPIHTRSLHFFSTQQTS